MNDFDLWQDFLENPKARLRDFSYAGNHAEYPEKPYFAANDYGIVPNAEFDATKQIQNALDDIGRKGGGALLLPKGKYLVNSGKNEHVGLSINYSHVTLCGEGSGCDGTVLFSGSHTTQKTAPYLSKGLIHTGIGLFGTERFSSPKELECAGYVTDDAKQGDFDIRLDSIGAVKTGDCVILCMYDDSTHSLAKELIYPLRLDEEWTDLLTAYDRSSPPYQWLAEVKAVCKDGRIVFERPLLRDILVKYKPKLFLIEMLENISIENIRFESAWDGGGYYHHKNAEADYGWNGIVMHRVKNGSVKNVHFHHFTQSVQLRDCKSVSVNGVEISGYDGHYGVKCYAHTSDCLVENVCVYSTLTHGLGVEGSTQGNVFRGVKFCGGNTEIDLHGGGTPSFNLFENVENIAKISGGGAIFNMPYCGQGNVYWNCSFAPCPPKGRLNTYLEHEAVGGELRQARLNELFHAWFWSWHKRYEELKDHEMYTASIVRGLRGGVINGSASERNDQAICVSAAPQPDPIPSLYEAQRERRRKDVTEKS